LEQDEDAVLLGVLERHVEVRVAAPLPDRDVVRVERAVRQQLGLRVVHGLAVGVVGNVGDPVGLHRRQAGWTDQASGDIERDARAVLADEVPVVDGTAIRVGVRPHRVDHVRRRERRRDHLGRNDWPYSLRTCTTSLPSGTRSPRFVKTWTTPFAASEPYSDDAAAPFTTSTRSMSSELMSARPCRVIVPSTMISGPGASVAGHGCELQAEGDVRAVAERSRIVGSPPGAPLELINRAPATFPSSEPSAVTAGACCSCDASTCPTAKV